MLIGIPSRAFVWVFRPLLMWVNRIANRLVAASGIDPVDRAAAGGLDVDAVRQLVEHSTQVGALEETYRSPLAGVIDLQTLAIGDLVRSDVALTAVAQDATVGDIHTVAAESGHMRILVLGADAAPRVVHVRDVLLDHVDVGQLVAVGIDLVVVGIALQDEISGVGLLEMQPGIQGRIALDIRNLAWHELLDAPAARVDLRVPAPPILF